MCWGTPAGRAAGRAVSPDPPELGAGAPEGHGLRGKGGTGKGGSPSCSAEGMGLRGSQVSFELDSALGSKSRVQSETCLHQLSQ